VYSISVIIGTNHTCHLRQYMGNISSISISDWYGLDVIWLK